MKKDKRKTFKGISLEKKWKDKHEQEVYTGSKSGNQFLMTIINYNGKEAV